MALHAALRPHDLLDGAGLLPRRDFRGRADHLGDPAHGRMTGSPLTGSGCWVRDFGIWVLRRRGASDVEKEVFSRADHQPPPGSRGAFGSRPNRPVGIR